MIGRFVCHTGSIAYLKEMTIIISAYFVADAWFSKKPFVDTITTMVKDWLSILRQECGQFSTPDIKTMNYRHLTFIIFCMYDINPNKQKNKDAVKELICYGTIAA